MLLFPPIKSGRSYSVRSRLLATNERFDSSLPSLRDLGHKHRIMDQLMNAILYLKSIYNPRLFALYVWHSEDS